MAPNRTHGVCKSDGVSALCKSDGVSPTFQENLELLFFHKMPVYGKPLKAKVRDVSPSVLLMVD